MLVAPLSHDPLVAVSLTAASKKIDWNLVANDPVLLQPISNGHAARMRYSRFRATVSGPDAHKRNRVEGKAARVTKPKGKSVLPKSRSVGPIIKQENSQAGNAASAYSPASTTTSPYLTDAGDDFGSRFLTPCSDDMAAHGQIQSHVQGLAINPNATETGRRAPNEVFHSSLDLINSQNFTYSPSFSAFDDATIDMSAFSADDNSPRLADCVTGWTDRFDAEF